MANVPLPPAAAGIDVENPWPGLASFTEGQRAFFHGRTTEIDTLFRHTRRRLLTVLFGQSGLGKSSLLHAGLFPRLRQEGFLPIYLRLDHAPAAPEHAFQVKAALVRALTEAGIATLPTEEESAWEFFHRRSLVLSARDGLPVRPVFVFDQFEEIFTLGQADTRVKSRTARWLEDLADLVENRMPASLEQRLEDTPELSERYEFRRDDYRVVISLREDYLPHFEGLRGLVPSLMQNRMRLNRMNGRQALAAVLKPGGRLVTPAVAEAIVRFVSGAETNTAAADDIDELEIEPPLLSLICHELNNQRRALGQDGITADLLAGNSAAILQDFYERCLADQPAPVRRFVEDELLTDSGFRENIALERAEKLLKERGAPAGAIGRLVDRRLLHIEERLNLRRVELTHDVLAGVVRSSRDSRRAREEGEASNQRAAEAERREHEARRRLWQARRAVVVTVLLLIVALAGAVLALAGQSRAARAQRLAQAAEARAKDEETKFRRIAIQADYTLATDALEKDDAGTAVAYLRRLLHTAPDERPAAALLWSILRDRSWCLPVLPPLGHGDSVNTVVYSPDGTEILTASRDGTARLWNAQTGAPVGEPMRHEKALNLAIFSPDGRQVATASDDGTARLWDPHTGKPVGPPLRHAQLVSDLAFSPDGKWLATASNDQTAGVWDTATGQSVGTAWPWRLPDGVGSVCFSPDGRRLGAGTSGGIAYQRDVATGAPIGQPMRHQPGDVYVSYSPDGRLIATGGADNAARLWDAATGLPAGGPFLHKMAVMEVMFSPDGRRLLTCSNDRTAMLWDVASGQAVGPPMRHANFIWRATFSPDGQRVLTTSFDGTARVWDAATCKPLSEPMHHQSAVDYGAFSPDGTRVVTASLDHTAQVWDARNGRRLTPVFRHEDNVRDAAFSPDGRKVATASKDRTARLWDAATTRPVGPPLQHGDAVGMVSFSPDGQRIVTAAADGTARVWSAADGAEIGKPLVHDASVSSAYFSPDGKRVLTASGYSGRIWQVPSGKLAAPPMSHDGEVLVAVFSPDGRQVATASSDSTARTWDAATGKPLIDPLRQDGMIVNVRYDAAGARIITGCFDGNAFIWDSRSGKRLAGPLHHDNSVWGVAFSPDGARVVTTSFDHTARIWNAATGKPVTAALRHGAEVNNAEFSADGGRLVSASFDGTARLWDVASGLPLAVPMTHDDHVNNARFSPDGDTILTASRDHTARIWDIHTPAEAPPGWFMDLAEAVGGKHLNEDDSVEGVPVQRLVDARSALAAPPGNGDFARFGRWFFADRSTRAISPFLSRTVTEFVSAQEDTGTLPALKEAAEVQPCDPLILARLARVEPDVQTAAFYVRLAMERAPDSAQVCQLAALALDRLGDGRAAADEIEKAVRLAPAQPEYRSAQGDILWRAGDHSGALSALDAAIQADPKNPAYLADRGLKRAIGGDNSGASADLEAALAAAPSTTEVRNECGWTLMQLGDFGRAADQFKAASTLGLPGLAACAWHVDLKEQAVATYLALIKYDNAYGGAGYLSAKLSAWGLPPGDLDLLETVRAATLEKYPEFKK